MNSLNDLRNSLDRHADLAPDGFGLVEQAQTGAARIRRRRRIVSAGVGAAAVVLVLAVAPALVPSRHAGPQVAAPADTRTSTQVTLTVAAGSGVTLSGLQSTDTTQIASATVASDRSSGERLTRSGFPMVVVAYDPGVFDPTTLRRGTPTTVGGQPAWLNADYPENLSADAVSKLGKITTALLGWQDPSGVWITVGEGTGHRPGALPVDDRTRTAMLAVGGAIRIGPVRDLPMPYRLGWLPPGVRIDAVQPSPVHEDAESHVDLRGTRTAASTGSDKPTVVAVQISIDTTPATGRFWTDRRDGVHGTRTTVAGHPAWYKPLGNPAAPSTLAVEIGNCGIMMNVWRDGISFAEQQRMVAAMTVVDCASPAAWIPLVR